jgi:hypothetical protein
MEISLNVMFSKRSVKFVEYPNMNCVVMSMSTDCVYCNIQRLNIIRWCHHGIESRLNGFGNLYRLELGS